MRGSVGALRDPLYTTSTVTPTLWCRWKRLQANHTHGLITRAFCFVKSLLSEIGCTIINYGTPKVS